MNMSMILKVNIMPYIRPYVDIHFGLLIINCRRPTEYHKSMMNVRDDDNHIVECTLNALAAGYIVHMTFNHDNLTTMYRIHLVR